MLIIKHRVNTIKQLKNTSTLFGVEIDLRSDQKDIYLHHEPFLKGVKFNQWIKHFKHKLIVLNVKEEGLEKKIIKILNKNKVNNYFFHDQTFSTLLKNMRNTKVSIRYSEHEEIKEKDKIFRYVKWVWLDHFTSFPLNLKFYKYLKKNKIKICIVSPELVSKKFSYKSKKLKEYILKKGFKIDAVCTKLPAIWKVN
jgi:hypothetical protein